MLGSVKDFGLTRQGKCNQLNMRLCHQGGRGVARPAFLGFRVFGLGFSVQGLGFREARCKYTLNPKPENPFQVDGTVEISGGPALVERRVSIVSELKVVVGLRVWRLRYPEA